jgi:hypothetical protein
VTYCEKSSDDEDEDSTRRHGRRKEKDSQNYDDASDYEAEEKLSDTEKNSNGDDDDDDDSIDICSDEEGESLKELKKGRIRGKESKVRVKTVDKGGRTIRQEVKNENPLNLVRFVPIGKLSHETQYEFVKRCLLKYKELKGDMLVPQDYLIPWNESYPEEMWGVGLGNSVAHIRSHGSFSAHKDELIAIGFIYSKQKNTFGWDAIKIALETYKILHGNLSIPRLFIVPSDSADWPGVLSGLKLGYVLKGIRTNGNYADHQKELAEMGVEWPLKTSRT